MVLTMLKSLRWSGVGGVEWGGWSGVGGVEWSSLNPSLVSALAPFGSV